MSLLKGIIKSVVGLLLPSTHDSEHDAIRTDQAYPRSKSSKRSAAAAFDNGQNTSQATPRRKKHKTSRISERDCKSSSHRSTSRERSASIDILSEAEGAQTTVSTPQETSKITDRVLMPPPSALRGSDNSRKRRKPGRRSLDQNDIASQATRSTRVTRSIVNDEYDMEEARRRAAATQLPPNSGIWETGEQELFFHLSYRGFEPLLPYSWMIDFPTLPISIFAQQDDDVALIQSHRSTAFRAVKALEELLEIGTKIRDHNVSTQHLQSEPILEKATKRYITWALQDLGLPVKSSSKRTVTPVHAIATMKQDQTTHDVLRSLAITMHTLADQYRREMGIRSSIETNHGLTPPRSLREETSIYQDSDPQPMPVIYGIAICRSIMTLFTLNCHTALPLFVARHLEGNADIHEDQHRRNLPETNGDIEPAIIDSLVEDQDLGLRYIAAFDFSDAARDVWNSFVIAILAMQIRKTLEQVILAKKHLPNQNSQCGEDPADESWLSNVNDTDEVQHGEVVGNDDPDA